MATKMPTEVEIRAGDVVLPGVLSETGSPLGVALFAHGSGSSRLSPRNQSVATHLQTRGITTLLFDLLTEAEGRDRGNVFDVEFQAPRLIAATEWLLERPETAGLPLGFFGASTGAGTALIAASRLGPEVAAVVSRGGRPDLAGPHLRRVAAPTLLIVGGRDPVVLELNEQAAAKLQCPHRIEVIEGATHLFEERGALEKVADLAADWFERWFGRRE